MAVAAAWRGRRVARGAIGVCVAKSISAAAAWHWLAWRRRRVTAAGGIGNGGGAGGGGGGETGGIWQLFSENLAWRKKVIMAKKRKRHERRHRRIGNNDGSVALIIS
jgi:hypothetical protein